MIAEIAQPLQAIIDIEKSRLTAHGIISDPSIRMESEMPKLARYLEASRSDYPTLLRRSAGARRRFAGHVNSDSRTGRRVRIVYCDGECEVVRVGSDAPGSSTRVDGSRMEFSRYGAWRMRRQEWSSLSPSSAARSELPSLESARQEGRRNRANFGDQSAYGAIPSRIGASAPQPQHSKHNAHCRKGAEPRLDQHVLRTVTSNEHKTSRTSHFQEVINN